MGLDARRIEILVDGSVEFNASQIANVIREIYQKYQKRVVMVGHSKGAVDISACITLNPDLIPLMKCFVAIQVMRNLSHNLNILK